MVAFNLFLAIYSLYCLFVLFRCLMLTLLLAKTALLSHINNKNCIITKCSELVIVIDFSFGDFTKNSTEVKDA